MLVTSQRKQWQQKLQTSAASLNRGGKTLPNIVIDANVWYSAIVYGGVPQQVLEFCLEHYQIVISDLLIEEIISLLKFKAQAPYKWLRLVRGVLATICSVVNLPSLSQVVRDPKDNHVLAAAMAGDCRYVITGDRDLLVLKTYKHVSFIKPADFMKLVVNKH